MRGIDCSLSIIICLLFIASSDDCGSVKEESEEGLPIFRALKGSISDSDCEIGRIDEWNLEVNKHLSALLKRPYFKYYRTVLFKECEFWSDFEICMGHGCAVFPCDAAELPEIYRSFNERESKYTHTECQSNDPLGNLDREMGEPAEIVKNWTSKDRTLYFCQLPKDHDDPDAVFVDLQRNPERFTGYRGESAWRIWKSIYSENCFWREVASSTRMHHSATSNSSTIHSNTQMCFENQVFYRVISGLHSSINVHLCAEFFFPGKILSDHWGYNLAEFLRRFGGVNENDGAAYLHNMYFLYILERQAILRVSEQLSELTFYASDENESEQTKRDLLKLIGLLKKMSCAFDDKRMFAADNETGTLKQLFSTRFVNITKIMDCVGCDKCRMWGRLQTQALGTAFNILFAENQPPPLRRWDIVALFNAFGRISDSITHLKHFKLLIKQQREQQQLHNYHQQTIRYDL